MADEENLNIAEAKAKLLHAPANLGGRCAQVAVDEDVALRCDDEIRGEVSAANVVDVPDHAMRREESCPVGVRLRKKAGGKDTSGEKREDDQQAREHRTGVSHHGLMTCC